MAKKKRAPDKDQPNLPGTIPTPSEALVEKAEELESVRDRRQSLQKDEADLQDEVLELMHKERIEILTTTTGRNCAVAHGKEKIAFTTPKNDGSED